MLVCLILMPAIYESNDDIGIRELVNGARKIKDVHLIYQNVILGYLYKSLYNITTQLPWYEIIQYTVLLCSFTIISYVLIQRLQKKYEYVAIIILLNFFTIECYVRPQYTKTAGIAASAGLFLVLWSIYKEKAKTWESITGIIFVCLGFMYRSQEALVCCVLITAVGIYDIYDIIQKKDGNIVKNKIKKAIGISVCLIICIGVVEGIDFISYRTSDEWQKYVEYNKMRTELLDYGFPDYESNQDTYKQLNINEDAYQLYSSWNFRDPEKFNISTMK